MSLVVEVAAKSDIGCVRSNNEDNLGFDGRYGVYVVCDGMGGQAAGEVASKIAVDSVLLHFRRLIKGGPEPQAGSGASPVARALAGAIQMANQAIFQASQQDVSQAGMGSTIVSVGVKGSSFSVAHVGDSRVYLIRQGQIQQLTNDHSLVMEQVRRGLISPEEAKTADYHNIVTRALGAESSVEVDVAEHAAQAGDVLLLCSDGLTLHIEDKSLLEIVSGSVDVQATCERLIQCARDAGGNDNITAMLLRFTEVPWWRVVLKRVIP